jgi:hypothetical protein
LVVEGFLRIRAVSLAAWLVVFSGLPSITQVSAAPPDCPLEKARYVIRDEQDMTVGFRLRQAGAEPDIFFFVRSEIRNKTAWFLPYRASGPGITTHLASTTDVAAPDWRLDGPKPLGDLDYAVTDDKDRPVPDFWFRQGAKAPAHILIPRLQDVILYGAPSDSHEGLSLAFLDFEACDPG